MKPAIIRAGFAEEKIEIASTGLSGLIHYTFRRSYRNDFPGKGVSMKFAKFAGEHLYWSLI